MSDHWKSAIGWTLRTIIIWYLSKKYWIGNLRPESTQSRQFDSSQVSVYWCVWSSYQRARIRIVDSFQVRLSFVSSPTPSTLLVSAVKYSFVRIFYSKIYSMRNPQTRQKRSLGRYTKLAKNIARFASQNDVWAKLAHGMFEKLKDLLHQNDQIMRDGLVDKIGLLL